MAQKHLQLLRNSTAYTSYSEALTALRTWNFTKKPLSDGTPVIARYTETDNDGSIHQRTLLGVVNNGSMDIINNVSDYLLRNYTEFTGTNTEIAATDDVKTAIAKLEKHINDSIADTTVSVSATTDPNTAEHLSVSAQTVDGGADIYWLTLTDVASASALTAETSARETADTELSDRLGIGVTTANTATAQFAALSGDSNSVSGDTSVEGAKRYADEKVRATLDGLDYTLAADANKVVVSLNQTDGKVSGTSVAVDTLTLDNYSTTADSKVASTDSIADAFEKLQGQIDSMNKTADVVAGQVVTTVAEADGKVTETKANVKDLQLGGYVKDASATGAISGTDTVNDALSKLENSVGANKITNDDHSIVVTEPTGAATTTDVKVNIKSGEKVIKLGNDGIYTNLNLVKITDQLPETVKERYELHDSDNNKIGESIDIAKDSHIVSINYITTGEHAQNLEYVYIDVSGNTQTTYVDMSELVLETEFASGVTATDHVVHGVVDTASEKDENNVAFLTVGADGFKVSGIKDAIDTKINKLDVTGDTAVAGQYVAAIQEADGIVSVKTRANVSDAVLNGYAKGSDATAVAATDTVNQAISKLENQVDKAKAAATTEVVEGTDAGNNLSITSGTAADGHAIYTVNLSDVASKAALDAEIAYRKTVDGVNGDAYTADTTAHYISGNSVNSLYAADKALDTALYNESTARTAAIQALDAEESGATDHVSVKVTEVDGVITDVTVTETNIASKSELYGLSAKTFTAAAMTGGTVSTATTNDGTVQLNINTDGSQVQLTGYQQGSESGAPVATDSVNAAISKLYNRTLATEVKAGSATTVSQAANGTTVDVKLDTTSDINEYDATHAKAVNGTSKNVLEITPNGLYLNNNWDCGTY